jgi:hypothetical protein
LRRCNLGDPIGWRGGFILKKNKKKVKKVKSKNNKKIKKKKSALRKKFKT